MNDAFLQPLDGLVAPSPHTYPCPEYSEQDWVRLGLQPVLEQVASGRAFLQEHGPRFDDQPTRANDCAALQSGRHLALVRAVHRRLRARAAPPDHLASFPELAHAPCYALDGHWHQAATHDPRHDGVKMAAGHFDSLGLRRHQLRHLTVGEGRHGHDMSVRQRVKNKLGEKKAWGASLVAQATPGQLVALTHNRLFIHEARLERGHGVSNAAEDRRRQERPRGGPASRAADGSPTDDVARGPATGHATLGEAPPVVAPGPWREKLTEEAAAPRLAHLYATL